MHDRWLDRLSEYLDGDLNAEEQHALEAHLAACDVCRATLDELRAVVAAAHSVRNSPPARDLWPHIATAIAASGAHAATPIHSAPSRRFSFTLPQLAAAAVTLMALSGTGAWLLSNRTDTAEPLSGTIVLAAESAPAAQLVASSVPPDTAFELTVAELERTLEQNRAYLEPATIEVIERSIAAIDRAIADSRAALAADPANASLQRQLANAMQKKIDVLRRVNRIRRAGA